MGGKIQPFFQKIPVRKMELNKPEKTKRQEYKPTQKCIPNINLMSEELLSNAMQHGVNYKISWSLKGS